jgi:hypothetical protein
MQRDPWQDDAGRVNTLGAAHVRLHQFGEFYPYYLSEHDNRHCRRLHFIGSSLVIAVLLVALLTGAAAMAMADAGGGLRMRLDRPLRFRKESPGHVQASALQPARRLGDVRADAARKSEFLSGRRWQPVPQRYFS